MKLYAEIEKNFPKVEKFLTEEVLFVFAYAQPDDLERYRWGLGTLIRLKLLRPKGVLYRKFIQEGFTDRDEMALEIMRVFHQYTQRKMQRSEAQRTLDRSHA